MSEEPRSPKPWIKFVGGKTQLLPELLRIVPSICRTYYEPFVGGGALFFALSERHVFKNAVLSDMNAELTNGYVQVQSRPAELMKTLRRYEATYDKDPEKFYYEVRSIDPATLSPTMRAARFIFLNKLGFNGLYRVNRSGKFNVPWGKKLVARTFEQSVIEADTEALRGVTIYNRDFSEVVEKAGPGDVVYFDPPYLPKSKTSSFTAYTGAGFPLAEHERLAKVARECADRGAYVVISNSDMPEVREIFKGFVCHEVVASRNVNSKGDKRGKIWELIFVAQPRK